MKILAFAASNNKHSINRILVNYAANMVSGANIEMLDIDDYEMPIFSDKRENELGQPHKAKTFHQRVANADAIIVSFAEHNGTYTAAYKNLFDWVSRIDSKVFQDKPVVYLATSPGPGGAANVLANAVSSATHFGADVKASLSIPSFQKVFNTAENTFINLNVEKELQEIISQLEEADKIAA
ncbi:MAG: chromate reductase [Candidatus Azotimanducaceae bacterium]|jgi:chromate reductase